MTRSFLLIGIAMLALSMAAAEAPAPRTPPLPPSPIGHFRQLLNMEPAELEKALAARSPKTREFLETKLTAYKALPPEERENRLRTLELRWYLLPLMKGPATNREARLQMMPKPERELVEARLKLWDQFSAEEQRELLESEPAINWFSQPEDGVMQRLGTLTSVTAQQQESIKKSTEYLRGLSAEKRHRIYRDFGRFFELSEQEKSKTLEELGQVERKQMERTLALFETLPRESRDRCIAGFQKFAALSEQERREFLQNAERWQTMSAKDRQIWRTIVRRKALPEPPLPPGARSGRGPQLQIVSTNRFQE